MPTLSSTTPATLGPPSKAYTLSLLSEYAHSLDGLPLDLSRIFADLRELDAVLTSTVSTIAAKIYRLVDMIENKGSATNEQRLWLLGEIAEDAAKVRPGADDKIRISTQAADALQVQGSYLTTILRHIPEYDTSNLLRKTIYPHVTTKPYSMPHSFESGRRRRVANGGGLLSGTGEASPNKRRRIVPEEDLEYGTGKTPRRDKPADVLPGTRPPRGNGRAKKTDRLPSPSESLLSVASPMPGSSTAAAPINSRNIAANAHRNGANGAPASSKRRSGTNNNAHSTSENASLLDSVLSRKDSHLPPSSSTSHPSLMESERAAFATEHDRKVSHAPSQSHTNGKGSANHQDRAGPSGQSHLEVADAPVNGVRASTQSSLTTNLASTMDGSPAPGQAAASPGTAAEDGGDGDGDDGKIYCICDNVSYGQMIACDDDTCLREWFHVVCVGLTAAPEGKWYCDECAAKRANRRPSRGGKKKNSGARSGARSAANGS